MKQDMNDDDEVIIIGGGKLSYDGMSKEKHSRQGENAFSKKLGRLVLPLIVLFLCVIAFLLYLLYSRSSIGDNPYATSRTTEEVVAALLSSNSNEDSIYSLNEGKPSVSMVTDSLNGVVFKLYTIRNLTMHIEMEHYPDESDSTIYFISRAMDYRKYDREMIGEYVVDGTLYGDGRHRLAYLAALPDGLPQIGIGREDEVVEFVQKNRGCMIRQFALVSAGQICTSQFELKGKVTRAAYARKADGPTALYFVETLTKETLYDFSEALVDYGFTDAIYITDGVWLNRFYRDVDKVVRETTAEENKKDARQYLVFKKISSCK